VLLSSCGTAAALFNSTFCSILGVLATWRFNSISSGGTAANRSLFAALCLVLLLGAGLRVQRYLLRAPFWRDEAFIVLDVRDSSWRESIGPLRYDQAAPPGFMLLEHAMAGIFGAGELSLRAVALVSGVAAMVVVAVLAWRLFGPAAGIFAGGLMAFCQNLIEYSAEVKQYSSDVLAAAILLLVALGWRGSPLRRLWRSAIAAAILVWFSHPAAILFAGIGAVLSIEALLTSPRSPHRTGTKVRVRDERSRSPSNTPSAPSLTLPPKTRGGDCLLATTATILAANALFAASFLLLYHYSIRHEHTEFLYQFWRASFPDWHHPRTVLPWLFRQTNQWLNEPYHSVGYLLAILALVAAPWLRGRRQSEVWMMAVAPLGLMIIAACFRQYPYGGSRLTLFTLPGFFLLTAAGGEALRQMLPGKLRPAWWLLPTAILGYGLGWGILRAAKPHYRSYLQPAIAYLQQHRQPNEPIYCLGEPQLNEPKAIFAGRHVEILCYWPSPPGKVVTVVRSLDELRGERFWVLIPFDTQDGEPALHKAMKLLEPIATPLDEKVEPRGGAATLYRRHGQ
jgi:hypothetical protein